MNLPTQIQRRLDTLGVIPTDVEEKFVRGSGPGGQKINKTSSTVCLRHVPTGVEVRVQRERSQAANRELAWQELCEKLETALRDAETARRAAVEKERRRKRPKSRAQKRRMVETKRQRRVAKDQRGRIRGDE
jgi:peptide chain release factor